MEQCEHGGVKSWCPVCKSILKSILKSKKMEPEKLMKEGFESLSKTRDCFEKAVIEYDKRDGTENVNSVNLNTAIHRLAQAYDEVSAIWENDINV
jgi:hypothetical protein